MLYYLNVIILQKQTGENMETLMIGNKVRFTQPEAGEENLIMVITEVSYDLEKPRAEVMAINSGLSIAPKYIFLVSDLTKI